MKFNHNTIGVIADIHLGVYQDSPLWHRLALDFARWAAKTYKALGIKDIVISGDIFHNRDRVSVNTIHAASDFFKILEDFNIIAIAGNHDAFYRDRSDISSISILKGWNNIHVILDTQIMEHNGKKIALVPWGADISKIEPCDIMFGHFEIASFSIARDQICTHGESASNLLDIAPLVMTGHFHMAETRKYEKGRIIYVGSPMELNWGEAYTPKYIWLLDVDEAKPKAIENKFSPKHLKFKSSQIYQKLDEIKSEVIGNFINVQVDQEMPISEIELLQAKISALKPLDLRMDYQINNEIVLDELTDYDFNPVNIEKACQEVVDKLTENPSKRKKVLNMLLDIYHQVN
jgi:DNA repair exonuclease SbcCD nuclease subunit